jgi:hypothetical protein
MRPYDPAIPNLRAKLQFLCNGLQLGIDAKLAYLDRLILLLLAMPHLRTFRYQQLVWGVEDHRSSSSMDSLYCPTSSKATFIYGTQVVRTRRSIFGQG